MNEFNVFVTDQATSDIRRITDYLLHVLCSEKAKDNFLTELERQKGIIAVLPRIYGVSRTSEVAALGGRVAPINKYLMIYTFDGTKIVIIHVFHSFQDYGRLI